MRTIQSVLENTAKGHDPTNDGEVEDFNPNDWYGGNADDTFNAGLEIGEIQLARYLLEEFFGITIKNDED